jgi:Na+-transporting methylmalonyl-CoA/oxaloacetate decarboxylase gamma subunit
MKILEQILVFILTFFVVWFVIMNLVMAMFALGKVIQRKHPNRKSLSDRIEIMWEKIWNKIV